jgi:hypothetical protein
VAKEIDVDRQEVSPCRGVDVCSDGHLKGRQFFVQLLGIQHGGWHAAQPASFKNGRSQQVVLRSGHGRLDQTNGVGFKKRRVHGSIIPFAKAHCASLHSKF